MKRIPPGWLPDPVKFPMQRVVVHWTAGGHRPNAVEKKAYHILIDHAGELIRGDHSIEANYRPQGNRYAAHVASMNIESIGVSMCGVMVARARMDVPGLGSSYPLTAAQWMAAVSVCQQIAEHFGWTPTETNSLNGRQGPRIIGHCEVQKVWGYPQMGKIDPWAPMPEWSWSIGKTPAQIADMFREQVWKGKP